MNSKQAATLLAALLLFVLTPAFAFSISAPEKTVVGSDWSFAVELASGDSYHVLDVFLDGKKLGSLYATNPPQFVADPYEAASVNNARFVNQQLIISLRGVAAGKHEIRAETKNQNGDTLQTQNQKVTIIDALSSENKTAFDQTVANIQNENAALRTTIDEMSQANAGLNNRLEEQNQKASELERQLAGVSASVDALQKNVSADKTVIQNLQSQVQALTPPKTESSAWTGFAGIGSAPLIGLGVLVIFGIAFFVYQKRKNDSL